MMEAGESVVHCTTIQWSELNVSVSLIEMYLGLTLMTYLLIISVLDASTNAGIEVQLKF